MMLQPLSPAARMKMTLGQSIVTLLVGSVLGAAVLIGAVAWITTRSSIADLRAELLSQVDLRVEQKMSAYFDRAEPALEFLEDAVFNSRDFVEDWEWRARLLDDFIRTEEDIVWLYYADARDGNMLGVVLEPETERYLISRVHVDNGRIPETYRVRKNGIVPSRSIQDVPVAYDPRKRPWFQKAESVEGMVWTQPYRFLDSQIMGITAARAVRDVYGDVVGVLAADMELGRMGQFLDEIDIGETGAAFLLLEGGDLMVPWESRQDPHVKTLQEALQSQTWDLSSLGSEGPMEVTFRHAGVGYITLVHYIDLPGPTRYYAAVVVPEAEYMDVVWRNAWLTLGIGVLVVLGAIALGVWQARRVTRPLATISEELEQIGNLSFRDGGAPVSSNILEVERFSQSVGKMKISLHAFSRYVPSGLVRTLLARGDEARLGGATREVTVVFTDLAGFTGFSESLPPDVAFRELSEFLEIVARHQERRGGVTSSFTGDGTLAFFNAPDSLPRHPLEACLSSLEIIKSLEELNALRREQGKFEFRARIGINTAPVLVGNLGTRERFAYTAIGDGVNVASRLEGLSKVYGTRILVGEQCREEGGSGLEWRKVDRIAVLGRSQICTVYEPLGLEGKVPKAMLEVRDLYEAGLQHYFDGEMESAVRNFAACLEIQPDPPADVMKKRAQRLLDKGMPERWDGIFRARIK